VEVEVDVVVEVEGFVGRLVFSLPEDSLGVEVSLVVVWLFSMSECSLVLVPCLVSLCEASLGVEVEVSVFIGRLASRCDDSLKEGISTFVGRLVSRFEVGVGVSVFVGLLVPLFDVSLAKGVSAFGRLVSVFEVGVGFSSFVGRLASRCDDSLKEGISTFVGRLVSVFEVEVGVSVDARLLPTFEGCSVGISILFGRMVAGISRFDALLDAGVSIFAVCAIKNNPKRNSTVVLCSIF